MSGMPKFTSRYDSVSLSARSAACVSTSRPQTGQKLQSTSSSALQAGQSFTVTFCPQYGQNVMRRPSGSVPPQNAHGPDAMIVVGATARGEATGETVGVMGRPDRRIV
jgi:hypothetical protein